MAEEEKSAQALEPAAAEGAESAVADELAQAIEGEPVDPELIEELRAAEADFRAAEKSHLEAKRQAEKAAEQLQAIIATVLDAAEVANKAASSASLSHKSLSDAAGKLNRGAQAGTRMSSVLLGVAGLVFLGAAGGLIAMTVQLHQKVNQADALLVRIGTQAISLKDSLVTVDNVGESIKALSNKNMGLVSSQTEISAKVAELTETLKAMKEESVKRDAELKKVAAESQKAIADAAKAPPKADPQLQKLLADVNALRIAGERRRDRPRLEDGVHRRLGDGVEVVEDPERLEAERLGVLRELDAPRPRGWNAGSGRRAPDWRGRIRRGCPPATAASWRASARRSARSPWTARPGRARPR